MARPDNHRIIIVASELYCGQGVTRWWPDVFVALLYTAGNDSEFADAS